MVEVLNPTNKQTNRQANKYKDKQTNKQTFSDLKRKKDG